MESEEEFSVAFNKFKLIFVGNNLLRIDGGRAGYLVTADTDEIVIIRQGTSDQNIQYIAYKHYLKMADLLVL